MRYNKYKPIVSVIRKDNGELFEKQSPHHVIKFLEPAFYKKNTVEQMLIEGCRLQSTGFYYEISEYKEKLNKQLKEANTFLDKFTEEGR